MVKKFPKPSANQRKMSDFFKTGGGGKRSTPKQSPFSGPSMLKEEMGMTQPPKSPATKSSKKKPYFGSKSPKGKKFKVTPFGTKKNKPTPKFGSQKKPRFGSQTKLKVKKKTPSFGSAAKVKSPPKKKKLIIRDDSDDSESEPIVPKKRKRRVHDSDEEAYDPMKDETGATSEQEDQDMMDCDGDESFEIPSPEKQKENIAPPPKKKRKMMDSPEEPESLSQEDSDMEASELRKQFRYDGMRVDTVGMDKFNLDGADVKGKKFKKPAVPDPDLVKKGLHNKEDLKKLTKKSKKELLNEARKKDPRGEDWYENPRDFDGLLHTDPNAKKWQCRIPKKRLEQFTPGMKDLWKIKQEHWDGVMLYKCGKFYEIYLRDAEICAEVCNLNFMGDDIPHVGFPESAIDKHIDSLVTAGYKIYRVEEMESAEEAQIRVGKKSAAKHREVCATYTPGTHIGLNLEEKYTFSIWEEAGETEMDGSYFHLVWLAASSADFFFDEFQDDRHRSTLRGIIAQYLPTEVLHAKGKITQYTLEMIRRDNEDVYVHSLDQDKEFWAKEKVEEMIEEEKYFEDGWPEALETIRNNNQMMQTFGGLFNYLKRHMLDHELMKQKRFSIYDRTLGEGQKFLTLDRNSIDNLHIFLNDYGTTKGTLFRLIDHCCTLFGARLLKNWLRRPLINISDIKLRQDPVTDLLKSEDMRNTIRSFLVGLPDMMALKTQLCRISVGRKLDTAFFHGKEFSKSKVTNIIKFLRGLDDLIKMYEQLNTRFKEFITAPRLKAITTPGDRLHNFRGPVKKIMHMFDYRMAEKEFVIQPGKGSGAKKQWDQLAKEINAATKKAEKHLEAFKKFYNPKMSGKKTWKFKKQTAKDKNFQVNVTSKVINKHGIPPGFRRDKGGVSNDELEELGNLVWDKKEAQLDIEANFANTVYEAINNERDGLDSVIECVAELDCLLSLARVSEDGWCAPKFIDQEEPILELTQSRHPCVNVQESMSASSSFIPNDISCGGPGKK